MKSAQTNPENGKVASNTEKMSENEMKKINKHLQWHPSSMWGVLIFIWFYSYFRGAKFQLNKTLFIIISDVLNIFKE